jgi:flavodoxin
MKVLVTYYSRTGNTRKVAEKIAKILKADLDEIKDLTDRSGPKGWLFGGRDASRKYPTEIRYKKDPKDYDLVVIGTPIWAWTVTPAVRTYLSQKKFPKVAFFATCGGSGIEKTFEEMERLSKKPVAKLGLKAETFTQKLEVHAHMDKIEKFCQGM